MLTPIKSPGESPADFNFLLIIFSVTSVYHEGDQRSKDHPGHGYPAHTETIRSQTIYPIKDQVELKRELEALYAKDLNRKDILVLEISRVVPLSVKVGVDL